jgi:SAM-dependent methyltransferase
MGSVDIVVADPRVGRAVPLDQALVDTQRAFDGVAAGYHRANTGNPTLCAMRRRARLAVDACVPRGSHILDLGCGPGEDAEHLAGKGYRVTAIDWSPAMADEARRRVRAAGVEDRVDVRHLGIHEIDRLAPETYAAAYSNFGPLNCVPDPAAAARLIADRLRPGGVLVASVIGRVCPWEIALYAARGSWSRAGIRFARDLVPVPLDGRTVWTRYYTPRSFTRLFAPVGFTVLSLRTLGLFVPPPYLQAFAGRHTALVDRLQWIEDRIGHWPGVRAWGDHFLIVMRKA